MPNNQRANRARILIVEDELLIAEEACDRLEAAGYAVVGIADSGPRAIELAEVEKPDLVLMDIRLKSRMDGIEAGELIYERQGTPVVYLTAHSDRPTVLRASTPAAFGYVVKPLRVDNLLATIEIAIARARLDASLREHQLNYDVIVSSIADGVVTADTEGRVRFMNGAAEQITGQRLSDVVGRPLDALLPMDAVASRPVVEDLVNRVLTRRTAVRFGPHDSLRVRHARLSIAGTAGPVIDGLSRVVGMTVTFRDVSEMRRAEAAQRALSQQLRAVVNTAVDGVMLLSIDGIVRIANPACERLFGYAASELCGQSVAMLLPSLFGVTAHSPGSTCVDGDRRPPLMNGRAMLGKRKNYETFPVEVSLGVASDDGDRVVVAIIHDASERKALEASYFGAVAREQRRLAQDLHDGLGQELTALTMLLSALERSAVTPQGVGPEAVARVRDIAVHAIATCRSVARGLMPVSDDPGGLVTGLRELVRRLSELPGPSVRLDVVESANLDLSPGASDHLYRIAQEALTNALKHAQAKSINVVLDVEPARVRLSVCDDGKGALPATDNGSGLGLRSMRYRAEVLGASLNVVRQPPSGTCIVCECPQSE
jgi:two-component system CheB/CheR fusion protein